MYRHILVPIDGSVLAVDTVSRAVALARSVGARITFFHAMADYGATSTAALDRVIAPAAFNEGLAGEARAILAKARAVAFEAGVPHEAVFVTSDRPHEAILDAAAARGCDLVFMASHGRRGFRHLMIGSETQRVLQHATIPVLVSSVESNAADPNAQAALAIIGDEHRSLAAVLLGLEHLVRSNGVDDHPPCALLGAILRYILEFPEKLHHPKEESYIFAKLRDRSPELDETLLELQRQHAENRQAMLEMQEAFARFESDPGACFHAFAARADRFISLQWPHMSLENRVVFPAARHYFTPQDWEEIAAAFSANGDPRFSAENDAEYRRLFARILNLMPEPGTAPVRSSRQR